MHGMFINDRTMVLRNVKGLRFYFQVSKLAFPSFSFIDAGRKMRLLCQRERTLFITHDATDHRRFMSPLVSHVPQFPQGNTSRYR